MAHGKSKFLSFIKPDLSIRFCFDRTMLSTYMGQFKGHCRDYSILRNEYTTVETDYSTFDGIRVELSIYSMPYDQKHPMECKEFT